MMRARALVATGGVIALGLTGLSAPAFAHPGAFAGKGPASSLGRVTAVTTIPGSSAVLAVLETGAGNGNMHESIGLFKGGHASKVKAKFGGRYGGVIVAAAGSKQTVWVAGSRQDKGGIQSVPAIYRLKGKRLVAAKLPPLIDGEERVDSVSASSGSNAWAVGDQIFPAAGLEHVALHWNGKHWSTVDLTEGYLSVSTSSPSNAWAIGSGSFATYHWDGHAWTQLGTMPTGFVTPRIIATSAPNSAYAIASGGIARWTGTKWVVSRKVNASIYLTGLAARGKSVWAVGYKHGVSGANHGVVLHTSGGKWKTEKISGKVSNFESVSASSAKHAVASGFYLANPTVAARTVIAKVTAKKATVVKSKF